MIIEGEQAEDWLRLLLSVYQAEDYKNLLCDLMIDKFTLSMSGIDPF